MFKIIEGLTEYGGAGEPGMINVGGVMVADPTVIPRGASRRTSSTVAARQAAQAVDVDAPLSDHLRATQRAFPQRTISRSGPNEVTVGSTGSTAPPLSSQRGAGIVRRRRGGGFDAMRWEQIPGARPGRERARVIQSGSNMYDAVAALVSS